MVQRVYMLLNVICVNQIVIPRLGHILDFRNQNGISWPVLIRILGHGNILFGIASTSQLNVSLYML